MVHAERERERKFSVDEAYEPPDLSDLVRVRADGTDVLVTTYFDTPDLRLWRQGAVLRRRTGGPDAGWHLKLAVLPAEEGPAGMRVRDEIRFPPSADETADTPPAALLDLIRVLLADQEVGPHGCLRTERTRSTLLRPDGTELAELADDRVTVEPRPGPGTGPTGPGTGPGTTSAMVTHFRELEVEDRAGARGAAEVLDAVAERLHSAGAGSAVGSKATRLLGDPQALGPLVPPVPELTPDSPARSAVQAYLTTYFGALRREDLRVRLDAEDSVHQFRVATRRLRAGLRAFRPLIEPGWGDELNAELRWLAHTFAPLRDTEVQRERLLARADRLPDPDLAGRVREFLGRRLDRELADAWDAANRVLASERYLVLHERLRAAAWAPRTRPGPRDRCGDVLPPLANDAWRRLDKAARSLGTKQPDAVWHRARIRAKRARYTAEACAPALGKPAARLAKRLSQLTDLLGEHQDAVVAAETLTRLATTGRVPVLTAYWLGVMHEQERAEAGRARAAFPAVWADVRRPKFRNWLTEGL
ncbi:CYTH and CHAD domain-containing protein [Actinopolymorpha pittospori]|uniref:CHAD domain-containing protein n=1 Tax=Actinopolymorpha pittospori TaxID=648752 RepID=A0A927N5I9_9ACTN|nr:CYTH and CHAD domain-containing protein [Actinopolymorpha pittospori]MBE1612791.1 CHAD domain-containing protein [Actinopolymorpha pittospori]